MDRPPNKPCPQCGSDMDPRTPSMPMDWPGADEYDHYWCDQCGDAFDMEDVA